MAVFHKLDSFSHKQQKVTKREGMIVWLTFYQMLVTNTTGRPSPSSGVDLKTQKCVGKLSTGKEKCTLYEL